MIARALSLLAIAWALGFAAFMLLLGEPAGDDVPTDAIAVPTGAVGRIDRGLALLADGRARALLVTGVGPGVRPVDLAARYARPPSLFARVSLEGEAVDTRSNAREIARWLRARRYRSVRLVTSDWHMARARMELRAALGDDPVGIVGDGVPSEQRLGPLVNEYNKLILRWIALRVGLA